MKQQKTMNLSVEVDKATTEDGNPIRTYLILDDEALEYLVQQIQFLGEREDGDYVSFSAESWGDHFLPRTEFFKDTRNVGDFRVVLRRTGWKQKSV
jgi:hypothetical protein